jgi:NAD(P)-dependent dehydrogenase (short-subunit alcohol dehydrogenase family)
MRLKDKIALVTGGAQGIGAGIVARFAAEGATVVSADIAYDGKAGALRETENAAVLETHCDVGDEADVAAMVAAISDRFGRIDVCISNAAIVHKADFLELDVKDFDAGMRVNLRGVFLVGQAVARDMVAKGVDGSIVNMSSVNAVLSHPNLVPYVCSKGAVNQLTKSMGLSLAKKGVRVNAIGPGSINTEMFAAVMGDESARAMIMSRTPMGRPGEVEEIASAAVFLATPESSYMTGQTIYVDGGRLPLAYTV